MIQNRDHDFVNPTRDEEFVTQRRGARLQVTADRDEDFLATTGGWPGAPRQAAMSPPPAPPPSAFLRAASGELCQSINLSGDSAARWRVRVDFDGTVAGEPVTCGDVLVIGRAIFASLMGHPFKLLSGGV